jgi:hypothetical protein
MSISYGAKWYMDEMGFPPKWKEEPIFKNTKSTGNN